jgi:GntR family transcriptional regulator
MLQIDLMSRIPIYEQVVENMKRLIISGVLKTDEKLPSVRDLSHQMSINPNTIQKAYRELEHQHYIYSVKGRGTFVANRDQIVLDDHKRKKLLRELSETIREMIYIGINPEVIRKEIESILNRNGGDDND